MDLSRRFPPGLSLPSGVAPGLPPGLPTMLAPGLPLGLAPGMPPGMPSGMPPGMLPLGPQGSLSSGLEGPSQHRAQLDANPWGQLLHTRALQQQQQQQQQQQRHHPQPSPNEMQLPLHPGQPTSSAAASAADPQWLPVDRLRHLLHQYQRKHPFADFQHPLVDLRQGFTVLQQADRRHWRRQQRLQQQQQLQRENLLQQQQQQQENLLQQRQLERLMQQQHIHQMQQQQQQHAQRLHRPVAIPSSPSQSFGSDRISAFHRVLRGREMDAEHVACGRPMPALGLPPPPPPPPEPQPCALPVLAEKPHINYSNATSNEVMHFPFPRLPESSSVSGRRLSHLVKEESDLDKSDMVLFSKSESFLSTTSPPITESELPIKKRKPRVTELNVGSGQSFRESNKGNTGSTGFSLQRYICELTAPSINCYKCQQMRKLELVPGPSGNFRSWNSLFVQQWLFRTLKANNPELPLNVICCLLQKLDGKNGLALSTYTKKELRISLDNIEGHEAVYDLICRKMLEEQGSNSSDTGARGEPDSLVINNQTPVGEQTRINVNKPRRRRDKCVGQLWEFIYSLLENQETNPSVVTWENKNEKLFRIVNTEEIARRWGDHKGNTKMTYANMSRTMRYYREGNGAFVRNDRKRVYGFGPKADFKRLQMKLAKRK